MRAEELPPELQRKAELRDIILEICNELIARHRRSILKEAERRFKHREKIRGG